MEDNYEYIKFLMGNSKFLLTVDGTMIHCDCYIETEDEIIPDAYPQVGQKWIDLQKHIKKKDVVGWVSAKEVFTFYNEHKCKTKKEENELNKKVNEAIKLYIKKLLDLIK